MRELNPTAYVILGMLRLGSQTGYEIKRTVDLSTRFFWAASHAQIYPELKGLERDGLISGASEPRGARKRVVYVLEPAGEAALQEWIEAPETLPFELRDMGLLKLFFADATDREAAVELVRRMRERHKKMATQLRKSEPPAKAMVERGNRFPHVALEFGLGFHEWAIAWCERLIQQLSDGH